MSITLKLLLARFPGAIQIPLAHAAAACGISTQTARNQLVKGVFPIPTFRLGGRRMVRLDDLASHLDAVSGKAKQAPAGPRRGTSLKAERLAAKAAGLTVKQLRVQEGGAA